MAEITWEAGHGHFLKNRKEATPQYLPKRYRTHGQYVSLAAEHP